MNIEYILEILYKPFRDFFTVNDVLSLISVNTDLCDLFNSNGFAKNITYSYFDRYKDFIERLNNHKDFVKMLKLDNIKNPFIWLPLVQKQLIMHECHFLNINYIRNIDFSKLLTLKLDKCYNTHSNIIDWDLLKNLTNLDIQYITHDISFKNLVKCKNLKLFCFNAKHLSIDLHYFNGLDNLEYFITNCYIDPEQILETPKLKYFIGDVKNIIIKSQYIEYVNIGTEISTDIIKYDNDMIQLYDITLPFEFNNFVLKHERLNDGYLKYFTQTTY